MNETQSNSKFQLAPVAGFTAVSSDGGAEGTHRTGAEFVRWLPGIGPVEMPSATEVGEFIPSWPVQSEDAERCAQESRETGVVSIEIIEEARQQAEIIIAQAKREAQKIQNEAQQRIEQSIRQRTEQEVRAVQAEERAKFEAAAEELLSRFQQAADETLGWLTKQLSTLAATITAKVVQRKVAEDDQIVLDVIRGAISQLPDAKKLYVVVNPADESIVAAQRELLIGQASQIEGMEIATDDEVGRGGCLLDSDRGEVDARLSSQLEVIWDKMADTDFLQKSA